MIDDDIVQEALRIVGHRVAVRHDPVTAWESGVSELDGVVIADVWECTELGCFVVDVIGPDEPSVREYVKDHQPVGIMAIVRVRPPRWYHRAWARLQRSRLARRALSFIHVP